MFYPKVKAGHEFSQGEVIGEIRDLKGRVIEEINASTSGIIFIRMTNVTVNSGDTILILGELEK